MDILEALAKQNPVTQSRIMCEDGYLSVSDAVFEVYLWRHSLEKEEIEQRMGEPLDQRHLVLEQMGL
jgi:hypothetical protein